MFCHLEAAIHGAFQLIKQERVPLKSTGRNINSPVETKIKERMEFLELAPRTLRLFNVDMDLSDEVSELKLVKT